MKKSIFHPDKYFDVVTDIEVSFLKENDIKGLLIDMDNTILNYDDYIIENFFEWNQKIKDAGIKIMLFSNSAAKERVENLSNKMGTDHMYCALKPLSINFKKAKKKLGLDNKNIGVIGDQIFTDILGANKVGMYSILVKPLIKGKEGVHTRFLRRIEDKILDKYFTNLKNENTENIDNEKMD